jgi:PIN domain nuclease of toxin-antitoxin system
VTLIDTHIWIWWVSNPDRLQRSHREILNGPSVSLALSVISCWELATLAEYGRIQLDRPVEQWISAALALPNLDLLPLTSEIAVASTQLPGPFHRDPADQIIVATARVHKIPLLTEDARIVGYPHVQLA